MITGCLTVRPLAVAKDPHRNQWKAISCLIFSSAVAAKVRTLTPDARAVRKKIYHKNLNGEVCNTLPMWLKTSAKCLQVSEWNVERATASDAGPFCFSLSLSHSLRVQQPDWTPTVKHRIKIELMAMLWTVSHLVTSRGSCCSLSMWSLC